MARYCHWPSHCRCVLSVGDLRNSRCFARVSIFKFEHQTTSLTCLKRERMIFAMRPLNASLVFLFLLLTFNAYACVLPLQPESGMDCSSATEQPVRQTCDAFLELGPQSHASFTQELPTINMDFDATPQLPTSVFLVFQPEQSPRSADSPTHLSIPTTVLRI
jgi:hypothetical protein